MLLSEALAQLLSTGNSAPFYSLIRNIIKISALVLLGSTQFTVSAVSLLEMFALDMKQIMTG